MSKCDIDGPDVPQQQASCRIVFCRSQQGLQPNLYVRISSDTNYIYYIVSF